MFSNDPQTQSILAQMAKDERERKEFNQRQKEKFEAKLHERFCYLPRRTTSGQWIWMAPVYVRYKARKKSYIKHYHNGAMEVTDVYRHYMHYEYERGRPIEVLSGMEAFMRGLEGK